MEASEEGMAKTLLSRSEPDGQVGWRKELMLSRHTTSGCSINAWRDFPGGPVAKTLSCQCRGVRFDPW